MKFRQLFSDEDAVSPVIGVILMVAITVILAAVIGTFVLGLGENVNTSAPQVNFQFEYTDSGNGHDGDPGDYVDITHTGGEDVEASNIQVTESGGTGITEDSAFPSTISTGSSARYTGTNAGQTIRVIWESPSGGSSQTIGQSTVPS